jgi:hypothetical protein
MLADGYELFQVTHSPAKFGDVQNFWFRVKRPADSDDQPGIW